MRKEIRVAPWLERLGRTSWLIIGVAGAFAILAYGVVHLHDVVVPLVLATFLSVVFAPAVDWLERWRVPRGIGAGIVVLTAVGVFVGAIGLVVIGVIDSSDELSLWFDQAQQRLAEMSDSWMLDEYLQQIRDSASKSGLDSGFGSRIGSAAGSAASFLSGLALGLVLFFYLLQDGRKMVASFIERHRPDRAAQFARIAGSSVESVRNYVRGRTILALIQGVVVGVLLWIMDVPLPLAIGVVTVITAYIPYLGAFVGGAFAVVMGLAGGGTSLAISALAVILFVNLVLENALEPRITGSSLKLHPVAVLLATVAGGLLFGMVGFVLASPITAICRSLYKELRESGFFDPDGDDDEPAGLAEPADLTDPADAAG